MALGEILSQLIEEKQIEKQDFAKIINVSPQALSGYLTNYRTPNDEIKKKIANYFNVTVDYLIGRTENKDTSKIIIDDAEVEHAGTLTDAEKILVRNYIKFIRENK